MPVALEVAQDLARSAVHDGGHGPSVGHDQQVARDGQVSLGREARVEQLVVVDADLLDELGLAVAPDELAGLRLHRDHVDAQRRPDARAKIDRPVGQHRPAADGPVRDKSAVAQMAAVGAALRRTADLPQQLALGGADAVEIAVVAAETDPPVPGDRRHPHRPVRTERPDPFARVGAEGGQRRILGRGQEERLAEDDRFVGGVEVQARLVGPGRAGRGQRADPAEVEFSRQALRADPASRGVAAPRGPVGPARDGGQRYHSPRAGPSTQLGIHSSSPGQLRRSHRVCAMSMRRATITSRRLGVDRHSRLRQPAARTFARPPVAPSRARDGRSR